MGDVVGEELSAHGLGADAFSFAFLIASGVESRSGCVEESFRGHCERLARDLVALSHVDILLNQRFILLVSAKPFERQSWAFVRFLVQQQVVFYHFVLHACVLHLLAQQFFVKIHCLLLILFLLRVRTVERVLAQLQHLLYLLLLRFRHFG